MTWLIAEVRRAKTKEKLTKILEKRMRGYRGNIRRLHRECVKRLTELLEKEAEKAV